MPLGNIDTLELNDNLAIFLPLSLILLAQLATCNLLAAKSLRLRL